MLGLIVAGEAVYALPYHVARYFRPSMLELFDMTATELGAAQGVYGIVAMLAYLPGGALADRFPARTLMASSLWVTAIGGLYLATFPGYFEAMLVWAFFGISTVLLFWAALIRAARDWGGDDEQGRAYGILDAGRGFLAAALSSIGVLIFALAFPDGYGVATFDEKTSALRIVIYGYTGVTAAAGFFVWFALPATQPHTVSASTTVVMRGLSRVMRLPVVWMQALIVFSAYVAYKGFDNYTLYAVQGWGMDEVEAAQIATLGTWVRPFAALGAGLMGDRLGVSRMLILCFVLLLISHLVFALTTPGGGGAAWLLLGNVVVTCAAMFGLRGLYFALFGEAKVPIAVTGAAIGVVSIIGYTPDIFVTLVAGILVDATPGIEGHQHFFWFLSGFAVLGLVTSGAMLRTSAQRQTPALRSTTT